MVSPRVLAVCAVLGAIVITPVSSQDALPQRLLHADDLIHTGSFTLPDIPGDDEGFAFANGTIAFNAANHSLFVVGHDWYERVAEVSIPEPGGQASLLQPLTDPFEGRLRDINPRDVNRQRIGGMFVVGDQLILSAYSDYDAEHTARASHFVRTTNLSARGVVKGPISVGSLGAAFTAGYFAPVPPAWQSPLGGTLLNGQCCLNIITRTSYGPSVSVVDPAAIIALNNPARAVPLVAYPENRQTLGPWDGSYSDARPFNGTSRIRGVVLPEGTASVLFFGDQGMGRFCYGDEDGCADPERRDQGNHAYPYQPHVWAYNAHDLAHVRAGRRRPWDLKPYATFRMPVLTRAAVGGAAVDPSTGRIYVTELRGDGDKPRIHIFEVSPLRP
jgi:hypothetical protein